MGTWDIYCVQKAVMYLALLLALLVVVFVLSMRLHDGHFASFC